MRSSRLTIMAKPMSADPVPVGQDRKALNTYLDTDIYSFSINVKLTAI